MYKITSNDQYKYIKFPSMIALYCSIRLLDIARLMIRVTNILRARLA